MKQNGFLPELANPLFADSVASVMEMMMTDIAGRVAVWFECEEGYPTEESILRLETANLGWLDAERFLLHDLPSIKDGISCMSVDIEDSERHGRPVKRIRYVTGGWSGAEDLVSAMLANVTIKLLHTKWERGGLFEFEVPVRAPS